MRILLLALVAAAPLAAANEQRLALETKALADFERVQKALTPQLREATACVQSQAALLAVAGRELLPLVHYRKGYCTLAGAVLTGEASQFATAAAAFEKAVEGWPLRNPKYQSEPVPAEWKVLGAIAALHAGVDEAGMERARYTLASADNSDLPLGRQWLGWLDLRAGNLEGAVRYLAGAELSGWTAWAAGRKAFRDRNYQEAARQYRSALVIWDAQRQAEIRTLNERLSPQPDIASARIDLGSAQLLASDYKAAIETLSKTTDARALFLRARARELAGQTEAALADYNLASRTAFAGARDLASGEAHLYRGIVLFRRKDYTRAETEFSSALNFEIPAAFRGDAVAWRHMAAVAAGSCEASRWNLERALPTASPYFPREEARALLGSCPFSTAGSRL